MCIRDSAAGILPGQPHCDGSAPGRGDGERRLEGSRVPGALDDHLGAQFSSDGFGWGETFRGTGAQGDIELRGIRVDADDRALVLRDRHQQRRHADPAQPDDRRGITGVRLAHVEHGSSTGERRAAEQCGDVRWNVGVDRYDRARIDHGALGESGYTEMVVNLFLIHI